MEKYWKFTIAAFLGVLLFAFDFEIFLASIPGLIVLFKLNLGDVSIINDTAFGVSAVSAFLFGFLADRYGRRLLFMLTVLIYSIGSFFTGLSFSTAMFAASRSFASIGAGSDEPLGFTLTAETAPHEKRGRQMLITSIGFPVGQTLGAAAVYLFEYTGIKITYIFFIGVLPALLILYFRRALPETERFQDYKNAKRAYLEHKNYNEKYPVDMKKAIKNSFSQMFDSDLRKKSAIFAIYTAILSGSATIYLVALPIYFIEVKHIAFLDALSFEFISFGIGIIGYVFAGLTGNRIGRRNVMIIFMILSAVATILIVESTMYYLILAFNVVFIFFLLSQWAAWPFYVNDMFPTRVRATASTYGYAFMWIGNIILPTLLLSLVSVTGWNYAIIYVLFIPLIISAVAVSVLPLDKPNNVLENNAI
ncbi:MFS transporter [Picrophilus oshimae]|uniref:Sugar phosphate permease n=1 Tax=Picrophilus torridus (strain ATCC 700027 / DSM 9790 / JCM 10055 / NBRC 100828 / KAW 2/3) TaxID=1122961 RepID=Q6KZZ1_PICTO|nr:MFS transporter [Picrophilus oshimae]AAT43711.1 sugar transporter [Picrophilus oshimae DSM 9789]SMD31335.1 Sugar phosphate permease [Picrophilus oshimae DSM 9789]